MSSVSIACAALGCAGPTAPRPDLPPTQEPHFAAGTVLSFRSGENDRPVVGAEVSIAGRSPAGEFHATHTSDGVGQIRLDRDVLHLPVPLLEVEASGFLQRQTFLRTDNKTEFQLWPSTSPTGLDDDATRALVYGEITCPGGPGGFSSLHRLVPGTASVTIVPDESLGPEIEGRIGQAIARMNAGLGGEPRYLLATSAPATGVTFDVRLGGGGCDGHAAFVSLTFSDEGVTGGTIVYCSKQFATVRITLHELGHTFGLKHSNSTGDVMRCGGATVISPRETLAMKLMLLRAQGNHWPDSDPGYIYDPPQPLSTGGAVRTEIIRCPAGVP